MGRGIVPIMPALRAEIESDLRVQEIVLEILRSYQKRDPN